jgi:hypothetical protein
MLLCSEWHQDLKLALAVMVLIANDAGVSTSSTHTRLKQSTLFSMAPALFQQHPLVQKKV